MTQTMIIRELKTLDSGLFPEVYDFIKSLKLRYGNRRVNDPVSEINAAIAGIDTSMPDDLMAAQMEVLGDEDW
jgi:hypothetical protein